MKNQVIEGPTATERQVSGVDRSGQWMLSVLSKRTYRLLEDGSCIPAEELVPLQEDPVLEGDGNQERLVADTDLIPIKHFTDVVITGSSRSPSPRDRWRASVFVNGKTKHIVVIGDRRCFLTAAGSIGFTSPDPITEVPLQYQFAFGGSDELAEKRFDHPLADEPAMLPAGLTVADLHRCVYPRNPVGTGYLVDATPQAVEALTLPNLEDPDDLLTPERLAIKDPDNWPVLPVPQATEWMHYGWFPRVAFLGMIPDYNPSIASFAEVSLGFAPPNLMELAPPWDKVDQRAANGASVGLRVAHLGGGEAIGLENIHPHRARFAFQLPTERPKIWTDGRNGALNETEPVIHTVHIVPDECLLTVVWRGAAPALRPYFPDEIPSMPFRVTW